MEKKDTGLLIALAATLMALIAVQSTNPISPGLLSAFAQISNSTLVEDRTPNLLRTLLESSEGVAMSKMAQLESAGSPVPLEANDLYSLAVAEKNSALNSLDQSDVESAKTHTLAAMKLFKQLTDLVNEVSYDQVLLPFSENTNDKQSINERLAELNDVSTHLRTVAATNDISSLTDGYFADCSAAIALANLAILQNNIEEAEEQVSICEATIDAIQEKMESEVIEADHSERAKEFANNAANRVEELIINAREIGMSEADLVRMETEWQDILSQLENANDVEYIIQLAEALTDGENKVQELIREFQSVPTDDDPVINEPADTKPDDTRSGPGGSNSEEPSNDEPASKSEQYLELQDYIADLKSKANEAGLPFPANDVDEMLSSVEQHLENNESGLADEQIQELEAYLDTINDIIQGYVLTKAEVTATIETAESLEIKATELNYLQFLTGIEDSLALLGDTNAALDNLASAGSLSYSSINSAHDHIDLANELLTQANLQLEDTQASLDAFIAEVAETLGLIEQEEARADEIENEISNILSSLVNDILDILDQARGLLADARDSLEAGELEQAQEQLSEASSLLATAEGLLVQLLDLPML